MARRFHPDNNYGFDTTEMMTMINTSRVGLQDQLHANKHGCGGDGADNRHCSWY